MGISRIIRLISINAFLPDHSFKNKAIQNPATPIVESHISRGFPVAFYNTVQGGVFVATVTALGL